MLSDKYVLSLYRNLFRIARKMPTIQRQKVVKNRVRSEFWLHRNALLAKDICRRDGIVYDEFNPPNDSKEFWIMVAEEQLDQLSLMGSHLRALKQMDDTGAAGGTFIPVDIDEEKVNISNLRNKLSRWGRWEASYHDKLKIIPHNTNNPDLNDDKAEFRKAVKQKLENIRKNSISK